METAAVKETSVTRDRSFSDSVTSTTSGSKTDFRQGSTLVDDAVNVSSGINGGKISEVEVSQVSEEQAKKIAEEIESAIKPRGTGVRFNVSVGEQKFGSLNFQVVNNETGEVVREFPSEELMEVTRKLSNGGFLVDETA